HDLRALVLVRLPHHEDRALGIRDHRHPAGVHHVERLHDDTAAGIASPGRGLVRTVDPDVGVPARHPGRALGDRAHRGYVHATDARHEVLTRRIGWHHVLQLPAEEVAVE